MYVCVFVKTKRYVTIFVGEIENLQPRFEFWTISLTMHECSKQHLLVVVLQMSPRIFLHKYITTYVVTILRHNVMAFNKRQRKLTTNMTFFRRRLYMIRCLDDRNI